MAIKMIITLIEINARLLDLRKNDKKNIIIKFLILKE